MRPPSNQGRMDRRRWLSWALAGVAGAALLAAALWLCVAVLPQRLYPPLSSTDLAGLSPADQAARREGRAKLQNDARATLLQSLAALLVLSGVGIGAAVTLRQVRIGREQLQQAREQAQRSDERAGEQLELARQEAQRSDERARVQLELARDQARHSDDRLREQIAVAQEGQITERFTRAVDQLGHAQLDVRIGGIYALERIARDSSTDRATIGEVLTAFVRSHAPWPPRLPGQYVATALIHQVPELQVRAADVQACLTVLGRGGFAPPAEGQGDQLDLHAVDLRRANLFDAHLEGAYLFGAHLEWANLNDAHLERANLFDAHLEGGILNGAYLEKAYLEGVHLEEAYLERAHLARAMLADAHMEEADLIEAHLEGAMLVEAHMEGTNLESAHLERANLRSAHLEEANLRSAHLEEAQLGGAFANRQTVWPDGWDQMRRAAAGVIEPDEEAPPAASPLT